MLSAITNRGKLAFMVFERRFTTAVFVEFLGRLVRHVPQKVFLIVDEHPVHAAGAVKRWVERHRQRLRPFFLPGLSSDLNPDAAAQEGATLLPPPERPLRRLMS